MTTYHVKFQVSLLYRSVRTNGASVRFFTCVYHVVSTEHVLVRQNFMAYRTLEAAIQSIDVVHIELIERNNRNTSSKISWKFHLRFRHELEHIWRRLRVNR